MCEKHHTYGARVEEAINDNRRQSGGDELVNFAFVKVFLVHCLWDLKTVLKMEFMSVLYNSFYPIIYLLR